MTLRQFVSFNIAFWIIAAAILFANSYLLNYASKHIDVAIARYCYFVIIGLMATFALAPLYKSEWYQLNKRKMLWMVILSCICALVTALILNPLLYLMAGSKNHSVTLILSTGTLYFVFAYFLWAVLYLRLIAEPGEIDSLESQVVERCFNVERLGEKRVLKDRDIECVIASGDYVELITAQNSYLKKSTLSDIESQLDETRFQRIHRSCIVNTEKIDSIKAKGGGSYDVTLEGGRVVQSSRTYKNVVESYFPISD